MLVPAHVCLYGHACVRVCMRACRGGCECVRVCVCVRVRVYVCEWLCMRNVCVCVHGYVSL